MGRYARRKAQPVCVEAVARQSPRRLPPAAPDPMQGIPRGDLCRLEVNLVALRNGATWQPASGRAMLSVAGQQPEIEPGDRVRCFAQLSAPRGPQNPGGFDDAARERADGILSRLYAEIPECVSVVRPGGWLSLTRLLDAARARSNRLLETYMAPRSAEMAEAVLLGQREQLESGRTENFMAVGMVHLLVIAGLHVGILAGTFFWLLRRTPLPRGWPPALVAAATLGYMLLVNAGPPVVRATVLVLVFCAASYLGRRPLSFNSLAAAALVVLAINPNHLFHAGAQLSFLSVAGLMWVVPRWMASHRDPLEPMIVRNLPWHEWVGRWVIWRSVRYTLFVSATIFALSTPLVMARFHLCTPAAIVLNALLWLPMACGLVSGAILLVLGGLVPPLGHLCGGFCNLNFGLLEWCVATARNVPGSHFWLPGPADWWLWGFYGGLGLLAAFPRLRPPRRWFVGLLAAWIAVGFTGSACRHDGYRLDCTFLSVGHGCAVLVELPSGQTLLYDAGQFDAP